MSMIPRFQIGDQVLCRSDRKLYYVHSIYISVGHEVEPLSINYKIDPNSFLTVPEFELELVKANALALRHLRAREKKATDKLYNRDKK